MGGHSRSSSLVFVYGLHISCLAILLFTILPCSGTRPLPAESKPSSMQINHRQYDDHEHNEQNNEPLHQRLQLDLRPSDVMGNSAFKPVFTLLPKGPVAPSGPSPKVSKGQRLSQGRVNSDLYQQRSRSTMS